MERNHYRIIACFYVALIACFSIIGCGPSVSQVNTLQGSGKIPSLIAALDHQDLNVRISAGDDLVKVGKPAVRPLIAALENKNWHIVGGAAWVLGEIAAVEAINPLIQILKYDDPIRATAETALIKIGAPAITPLIAALTHENENIQQSAAIMLGEIKDPRAVQPLLGTLKSEKWWMRGTAIEALGLIKDPRAVNPIIAVLNSEQEEISVRWKAAESLGKIKDSKATEALIEVLEESEDERLGWEAAMALKEIGDPKALESLIGALQEAKWSIRVGIIAALERIGGPSAIETLIVLLQSDDEQYVRMKAVQALGEIGDPKALDPLITVLKHEKWGVRQGTAIALGKIKGAKAAKALEKLAKNDPDLRVRKAAKEALDKIKGE